MDPQQPYVPPPLTPENPQPVAYDANGRPLYAHPPSTSQPTSYEAPTPPTSHVTSVPPTMPGYDYDPRLRAQYANEPGVIHASRQIDPRPFDISQETKDRHDEACRKYPHLNLSAGEYVLLDIKRHPIGLLGPVVGGGLIAIAFIVLLIIYPANAVAHGMPTFSVVALIVGLLLLLVGIGTFTAVWVYLQNQFFLTNESVIQEIQTSLFSRHEQTVSLGSIEDASFKQQGILQTMLNYGSIRLSTEGDETTYQFFYVTNPRDQVAVISNAIEAFKNGRPVDPYED